MDEGHDETWHTSIAGFEYHKPHPTPGTVCFYRSKPDEYYVVIDGEATHSVRWMREDDDQHRVYGHTNDWWAEVRRGTIVVVHDPSENHV